MTTMTTIPDYFLDELIYKNYENRPRTTFRPRPSRITALYAELLHVTLAQHRPGTVNAACGLEPFSMIGDQDDILIAVAILQFLTEIIIGFNYALGQVTITPMALLMTTLSSHSAATDMAVSRIYDTALGALVGIAFALLLSTMDERLHLARHHTRDR